MLHIMLANRRFTNLVIGLVFLVLMTGGLIFYRRPPGALPIQTQNEPYNDGLDLLRHHLELPETLAYAKQCIVAHPVKSFKQPSMTKTQQNLSLVFRELGAKSGDQQFAFCQDEIAIEYSSPTRKTIPNGSSLLVGVATTPERLWAAAPEMMRWITHSRVHLIAVMTKAADSQSLGALHDRLAKVGIDTTIVPLPTDLTDSQLHFGIVRAMHMHRRPENKWFIVNNDDTFFTSLPALIEKLDPYDPAEPWYIGGLTEDWQLVSQLGGYRAYGGAGIIMSLPLVEMLVENFEACLSIGLHGEFLFRECIIHFVKPHVPLTQLHGLHQLDFRGGISGWYEAGIRPILSLHHYRSLHRYPVHHGHLVTDVAGDDSFLQRFQFDNGFVLTNSYSVATYSNIAAIDFNRVEGTFPDQGLGQYDFSLGDLRPALTRAEKLSWRLEYAKRESDGRVRQFYIQREGPLYEPEHPNDDDRLKLKIESVIELEWRSFK